MSATDVGDTLAWVRRDVGENARARDEAVDAARRTGSEWLLARVGPEPLAEKIADGLTARLPVELRDGFAERGPLMFRLRRT